MGRATRSTQHIPKHTLGEKYFEATKSFLYIVTTRSKLKMSRREVGLTNAIVWTPIPLLTWLIPIIGHAGIVNSKGTIYDFGGDFYVSVDNFSFGSPTKACRLDPSQIAEGDEAWDNAIEEISRDYRRKRHSLFSSNCHQYIACILNKVHYENRTDWNQTNVWFLITFKSTYLSCSGFLRQWAPFTLILMVILVLLNTIS